MLTSSSPNHQEPTPSVPQQPPPSQAAVLIHAKSPVSVGICGWDGFERFIPLGARLPYEKTLKLTSAFDDIAEDTMQVRAVLPSPYSCVVLGELRVTGIRKARKEETTMRATMELRKDLTGELIVRFRPEEAGKKAEAVMKFSVELTAVENASYLLLDNCCAKCEIR